MTALMARAPATDRGIPRWEIRAGPDDSDRRERKHAGMAAVAAPEVVHLPHPRRWSTVSLEEALLGRRSVRSFETTALSRSELSQLLWAAQGITSGWGARPAPSAGALYPLDVYVAGPGLLCHYLPDGHGLLVLEETDVRPRLAAAAHGQQAVAEAAVVLALTAVYARSSVRYGARGRRYAVLEAGHVAQNVLLQAAALDLGAVPIGAFDDDAVRQALGLAPDHAPLYLIPVGRTREAHSEGIPERRS